MRLPGVHLGTLEAGSGASTGTRVGGQIALVVERRYRSQRQPSGLLEALEHRQVGVNVVDPASLISDLAVKNDAEPPAWLSDTAIVVARGRSPALLTALAIAEHFGIPTVNRSAAILAVRDKAAMAAALVAAGLPTPHTWVGPMAELARSIPPTAFPVVVKPVFGDNGRDVQLVAGAAELSGLTWPEPTALVQSYVECEGRELKLYVVGDHVWAAPAWPRFGGGTRGHSRAAPLVPVPPELRKLAMACGTLFGLDFYGVDCQLAPEGPVVLEVNDFPNYRGVAEASGLLAEYLLAPARRRS